MKIGILTQPLHSNYGGLLQAWALQKTLVEMGHDATIINRVYGKYDIPVWRKIAGKIKNELLIRLGKRKRYIPITDELKEYSEQNVIRFRKNRYLGVSEELKSNEELEEYIRKSSFDAYVVGSDQVWRPMYSPNLMTYFLDFARNDTTIKKIAYAASFGVDVWELSKGDTEKAKELASLFNLITVRESSGVRLVEKHLNCPAVHVLDPTMLRDKQDYLDLVEQSTCELHESGGELFCYVLDNTPSVSNIINDSHLGTGMKPYFCNYDIPVNLLESESEKGKCRVPPVEQWIKSFADAKMVITDSFHGVVFSIIFNKPFWVILNKERGASRFMSLLNQFNLKERIIYNKDEIEWNKTINWQSVNSKREQLSVFSKNLLYKYL